MTPAHTLHLTNAWHPSSGGIRTFYRALLSQATAEGRAMTLIVPAERTSYERVGRRGRIYYLAAPSSPAFDRRYRMLLPHRYLRPSVSAIWRILEREQPDLVEICDKYALVHLAGLIKGRARGGARPTVVGLSCERMDDNVAAWLPRVPWRSALAPMYIRRVYLPQFDAHIANSRYTAAELLAHAPPADLRAGRLTNLAARVHVSPMGVEAGLFGRWRRRPSLRASLESRAGATRDDALILYAGRLSPEKNVAVLPAVARELAAMGVAFRLLIAGDGPSRAALERDAALSVPGRVAFLGHVEARSDLADLLAAVDLFLHPNPREPFGIGPLEAMASGTAVVVPGAGGVLEYATPRNSWLADADPAALARAAAAALGDSGRRLARIEEGLRTAAAFAWPAMASRMLSLYDAVHHERLARGGMHPGAARLRATA